MKAIMCPKYGPPEVLQIKEVEKPIPKDNEVLIKVFASTVNRTDCAALRAKPFVIRFFSGLFKPKNPIPGTEFAGVIEATGKDISLFKSGDRVFGFNDVGISSHAQYMTLTEDKSFTSIPENISFEKAAASFEGAHYAYNFINKIKLNRGDKVLVNGATGGIGSAAVQLLSYFGAETTAVCEGKHEELVKSLGAIKVVDFTKEDFTKLNEKFNYVFDTVGKSTFSKCKSLLKTNGAYISSELGPGAQNIFLALLTRFFGKKKVVFPFPQKPKESILLIKKLIEEGKFSSVIDKEYPLEQIIDAFKYVETGQKIGNVVITINH